MVTPWEASNRPVESRGTWAACVQAEGVLRTARKTNVQSQAETTWTVVSIFDFGQEHGKPTQNKPLC